MLLRDLEYFLRIAETGSLRRAAQLVEVSQPAVTKGLKRLEAELGIMLVRRSRKGAALTEVGRSFLDRARRLRRDLEIALQEANDLRAGAQGLVRVGITPALIEPVFQPASIALMAQRPAARFRVRIALSDELLTALRQGEIDVMISGIPDPAPDEVDIATIGESVLGVIARADHPLMSKHRPQLTDLARCAWAVPRRGVLSRDWLDSVFLAHDLPRPLARIEFDPTHDGLIAMLLKTDLLSVGGESACRRMGEGSLAFVDIEALKWRRPVAALTRTHARFTPIVRRFLELLGAPKD